MSLALIFEQQPLSCVLQTLCYLGTNVSSELVFDGRCSVAPLVPSWFEREGRAKQTVHIIAALSGSKFLLMSLSSCLKLC